MEKEYRKLQNRLKDAGQGTILFAVWSVVKANMYLGLSSSFVDDLYQAAETYGPGGDLLLRIFWIGIVVVLLLYLAVRFYIGIAAMAEGKGKEKGRGYLIVAAVLVVMTLMDIWNIFIEDYLLTGRDLTWNLFTGFCMEIASLYVLSEVLVIGLRVKQLRKKMKE